MRLCCGALAALVPAPVHGVRRGALVCTDVLEIPPGGLVGIAMLVPTTAVFAAFSVIGIQLAGCAWRRRGYCCTSAKFSPAPRFELAVLRRPAFGSSAGCSAPARQACCCSAWARILPGLSCSCRRSRPSRGSGPDLTWCRAASPHRRSRRGLIAEAGAPGFIGLRVHRSRQRQAGRPTTTGGGCCGR